jgi:hypothetical protein
LIVIGEQMGGGALHVDRQARLHRAILQRADHLQAGPVADVGEARVGVPAERALHDLPIAGPVEDRAPELELTDPFRGLLGVQLRHAPVVEHLSADHRVAEVRLPRIGGSDVGQRGGDASLGHHRVRLSEERLADQPHRGPPGGRLDRGAQPGATCADDQDVVRVRLVPRGRIGHRRIAGSTMNPAASSRT